MRDGPHIMFYKKQGKSWFSLYWLMTLMVSVVFVIHLHSYLLSPTKIDHRTTAVMCITQLDTATIQFQDLRKKILLVQVVLYVDKENHDNKNRNKHDNCVSQLNMKISKQNYS